MITPDFRYGARPIEGGFSRPIVEEKTYADQYGIGWRE